MIVSSLPTSRCTYFTAARLSARQQAVTITCLLRRQQHVTEYILLVDPPDVELHLVVFHQMTAKTHQRPCIRTFSAIRTPVRASILHLLQQKFKQNNVMQLVTLIESVNLSQFVHVNYFRHLPTRAGHQISGIVYFFKNLTFSSVK